MVMLRVDLAAIEFASPAMLGWAAAAALPWLINLWARRRHVATPWAAIELLKTAVRERSRRLRLRELLLLAVRTCILLLVALASARPVFRTVVGLADARAQTHDVLVIDQSLSMSARSDANTRLDRAKELALRFIRDSSAGDAFTVIAWAERADNLLGRATFDADSARAAVNSISQLDTVANLSVALRAANEAIDRAAREFPGLARRRVAIISDLTATTWDGMRPRAGTAAGDGSTDEGTSNDAQELWQRLSKQTELNVENVDEGVRANAAITAITTAPKRATLDRPLTVNVELEAFGGKAYSALNVGLSMDGTRVGEKAVDLLVGGTTVATFESTLVTAGQHVLEARLPDDVDSLAADNRRWLALDARPTPRVICYVDAPGAADDVARALNPQRGAKGEVAGDIAVEVASAATLASTDLSPYDAVFVCNVAAFSPREETLLRRYVAEGGGLVFVLGDRIHPEAYNALLGAVAGEPTSPGNDAMLPARVAAAPAKGDWWLDPLEYRHPILAPFAGHSRAGLSSVRVFRYVPVKVDLERGGALTALALSSGDPAILIGDFGLGRVAVLATDPALKPEGESWSTLAVSPSFLPLVRELANFVAADRRNERLNRLAGESLAAPLDSARTPGGGLFWETPEGPLAASVADAAGGESYGVGASASLADARRRGVYLLRIENAPADKRDSKTAIASFAVNVDPRESDLTTVDPRDIPGPAGQRAAVAPGATTHYPEAIQLARGLLAAALVLLLVELLTAWAFGKGWA